jgi:hypothetical protein
MKQIKFSKITQGLVLLIIVTGLFSCTQQEVNKERVKDVIDRVVTELYKTRTQDELAAIDYSQAMALFSEQDIETLATRHWTFNVNVPATVSVMRNSKQKTEQFWLKRTGFTKTDLEVKHEHTTYNVWQKEFDAGEVGLGINGFENDGFHYFVSVNAKNKADKLELSNFFPENQYVGEMKKGAFIYHDWNELIITELPESLVGGEILTTIRGRGTESHLVRGFRTTEYPSSATPDQVMLTWSDNTSTTMDIQWRTNTSVAAGTVNYREKGDNVVNSVIASRYVLEDRVLMNDRYVHKFTAQLKGLKAGATYEYQIPPQTDWTEKQEFTTAADDNEFSFIWMGDVHHQPKYGELMNKAADKHPDAAFFTIAGDMVGDGTHRNEWDRLLEFPKNVISRKPFMNAVGNHDNRAGLGALVFQETFSYPKNGPVNVPKEQTYSFTYKNTLFLMIDATSGVDTHTKWIEEQLKNTKATWKIATFHFPPYNWEEPYYDIQEAWLPLFDQYHVDMVFSGHIHYYMRSKPMNNGEVVSSYNDGTAYIISIGIPSRTREASEEPYAEVRYTEGQYYQYLKIEDNKLRYQAFNSEGDIADEFEIVKK